MVHRIRLGKGIVCQVAVGLALGCTSQANTDSPTDTSAGETTHRDTSAATVRDASSDTSTSSATLPAGPDSAEASSSVTTDLTPAPSSEPPVEYPKVVETDGASRLDAPVVSLGQGELCESPAVYCNGACLDAEGTTAAGCTALRLQMGAGEIALDGNSLYYLAGGEEIVQVDLTSNTHRSLLRGLEYASALTYIQGALYFGAREVDGGLADFDVRRFDLSTESQVSLGSSGDVSGLLLPVQGKLLVGSGPTTPFHMYSMPIEGGETVREVYGAAWLQVDGDYLYNSNDSNIYRRTIADPNREEVVAVPDRPNARFFVRDGYIYFDQQDNYVKVGTDEVEPTVLATLPPLTRIRAQNGTHTFFVGDAPEADPDREAALGVWRVPLEGGELEVVATFENLEFDSMLVDDQRLFVTSGGGVIVVGL